MTNAAAHPPAATTWGNMPMRAPGQERTATPDSSLQILVLKLTQEVARLADQQMPWVTIDEMCKRYNVTPKTLTAMEQRGDIPARKKGKWLRSELVQWEAAK